MSEQFQPNWPLVRISDLAEINIGGTPSRAAQQFWATKPEGNPWIAISDLKGKYVHDTKEYINDLGAKCSNVKLIEPFTTVMSFKLTVGRTAITTRPMYCNEAIAIFSPKNDALSGGWLYHALPRAALSVVTDNAVKGATLNKAKMAEMTVQLPPITEQRKIAQILDTLDTAIRETEALIDKLKAVKQGLLHDLLTRGIDANGQLRPPQSEAPQLYKESPLGWIPREWTQGKLSEVLEIGLGFAFRSEDYTENGILSFRVTNIGRPLEDFGGSIFLPDSFWDKYKSQQLTGGEIVIVMVGATTGKLGRVPVDVCPALQNQNMWNLIPAPGMEREFLWMLLPSAVQRHLSLAQGSARDFLTQKDFLETEIAFPDANEQRCIISAGEALEHRIISEQQYLKKLSAQKVGLMDDLLTGRVRVTPLLESIQQTAAPTGA